jgi:hypothetical protein
MVVSGETKSCTVGELIGGDIEGVKIGKELIVENKIFC